MANDSKLYEAIGLGKLLSQEYMGRLKTFIDDKMEYAVAGFRYDYLCYRHDGYIESYYPVDANGEPSVDCNVSIHYCGKTSARYEIMSDGDTDDWRPILSCCLNGYPIPVPVFLQNADILPDFKKGRVGEAQSVAFAENVSESSNSELTMESKGSDAVRLIGEIIHVYNEEFNFDDVSAKYYEITTKTVFGELEILYPVKRNGFKPVKGMIITCDCYLSLDVAVSHKGEGYTQFAAGNGEKGSKKSGVIYTPARVRKYGFLIDDKTYLDAFCDAISHKNMIRLKRCCASSMKLHQRDKTETVDSTDALSTVLKWFENTHKLIVTLIVKSNDAHSLGRKCLLGRNADGTIRYLYLSFNDDGFITEFYSDIADDSMQFGNDPELYATACIGRGLTDNTLETFSWLIDDDCCYVSLAAGVSFSEKQDAFEHNSNVNSNVREAGEDRYSYLISRSADELCEPLKAPVVCRQRKWCIVLFYKGENTVAFLDFNEEGRVNRILLSCEEYLHRFRAGKMHPADYLKTGFETLTELRTQDPDHQTEEDRAWLATDTFVSNMLRNDKFYQAADDTEIVEKDHLVYQRSYKGKKYEYYLFVALNRAYVLPDAAKFEEQRKCSQLQGREARFVFIWYNTEPDKEEQNSPVTNWNGVSRVETYRLENLNGKLEYVFTPENAVDELASRLYHAIAEYDYDGIEAVMLRPVGTGVRQLKRMERDRFSFGNTDPERDTCVLVTTKGNEYRYDAVCQTLLSDTEDGKMLQFAYIRRNSQIYSLAPYVDGKRIYSITIDRDREMVRKIQEYPWNGNWSDFIPAGMPYMYHPVPQITAIRMNEMFEIEADFDNGESRVYPVNVQKSEVENAYQINKVICTQKMFKNGRLTDQTKHKMFAGGFYPGGQSIEFINGVTVSAAEIYYNGFSNVIHYDDVSQMPVLDSDFEDDGYTVSSIFKGHNNLKYLFDRKNLIAKALPLEYQDTSIHVYPPCGGYQDGMVMVNAMPDVDQMNLQYHHNRASCAGVWGWLDADLNMKIKPQYAFALHFWNDKAIVCKGKWESSQTDGKTRYWCPDEKWGVIDKHNNEIVPCAFDELYEIDGSDNLYFVHAGGWDNGHYAIYDSDSQRVVLDLDFDFDIAYMFNDCHVTEDNRLVFDEHVPGEGKEIITVYDLMKGEYLIHTEEAEGKTLNGESRIVVNKDGNDIIVF